MLMTPLITPRLRNTLRHDSRAARIVGCIVADVALNFEMPPGNARAALGLAIATSAKPSCENKCLQNVNAVLNHETNSTDILAVAKDFQFDHRLPVPTGLARSFPDAERVQRKTT